MDPGLKKRRAAQKKARKAKITELFLRPGVPVKQVDAARVLGISQPAVCKLVKELDAEWDKAILTNVEALRRRELKKLARREAYLEALIHQSHGEKVKTVDNTGGPNPGTATTTWEECADPRYFAELDKITARRAALLGLDAPKEAKVTGEIGLGSLTEFLAAIHNTAGAVTPGSYGFEPTAVPEPHAPSGG